MKKILFALMFLLTLIGCSSGMTLTNFQTGDVLKGEFNQWDRTVKVIMPNGEVLSEKYSDVNNSSMTFGTAVGVSGTTTGTLIETGISVGRSGNAYALLKSETSKLLSLL